jgi:hypothetical protein
VSREASNLNLGNAEENTKPNRLAYIVLLFSKAKEIVAGSQVNVTVSTSTDEIKFAQILVKLSDKSLSNLRKLSENGAKQFKDLCIKDLTIATTMLNNGFFDGEYTELKRLENENNFELISEANKFGEDFVKHFCSLGLFKYANDPETIKMIGAAYCNQTNRINAKNFNYIVKWAFENHLVVSSETLSSVIRNYYISVMHLATASPIDIQAILIICSNNMNDESLTVEAKWIFLCILLAIREKTQEMDSQLEHNTLQLAIVH